MGSTLRDSGIALVTTKYLLSNLMQRQLIAAIIALGYFEQKQLAAWLSHSYSYFDSRGPCPITESGKVLTHE